jgi:hypothetical protein
VKVFHRSKRKSQEDEFAAVWVVERDCLEKGRRREGEGEGVRGRGRGRRDEEEEKECELIVCSVESLPGRVQRYIRSTDYRSTEQGLVERAASQAMKKSRRCTLMRQPTVWSRGRGGGTAGSTPYSRHYSGHCAL